MSNMRKRVFTNGLASLLLIVVSASVFAQEEAAWQKRFKELDKDNNGELSASELTQKNIFDRIDADGNGSITKEEIRKIEKSSSKPYRQKVDVAYGTNELHKLDVYSPKKKVSEAPVMIYVHGGGWKKGDKSRVGAKPGYFTDKGWIFVSLNYRLLPDGKHPANVSDIAQAIAFIHDHAAEYGGDPDKMFLMGHSAGCHLVSLVATDHRRLEEFNKSLTSIKGVIALDTQAYDIASLVDSGARMYGEVFGSDAATQKDASPQAHIAKGKDIPPFVVAYSSGIGGNNAMARARIGNKFVEALKNAGVEATLVDASDRSHSEINTWFGTTRDQVVTKAAEKLFENVLDNALQK